MTIQTTTQRAELTDAEISYLFRKQNELKLDSAVLETTDNIGSTLDSLVNSYDTLAQQAIAEAEIQVGPTAADYLKSYVEEQKNILSLKRKLHEFESKVGDLAEFDKKVVRLNETAVTDFLTDLYNRRHLKEVIAKEISRSQREEYPLSVIMIDIDNFKKYNDTYGHVRGDKAIQAVANVLKNESRTGDTPFRYGGEEFTVLLPHTSKEEAYGCAERMRMAVENSGLDPAITISLGIADTKSYAGKVTGEELIDGADKKLYESKKTGKNKVTC